MNSMELVRFPTRGARPPKGPTKKSLPPFCSELVGPVRNAIVRARHLLVTQQRSDGSWLGRQTGDVTLASQLVFLLTYLERDDSELSHHCAATILNAQRKDGGWSIKPEGTADVSASVQAYFALKLTGHDPTDERMVHARERIRKLGGADAADNWTRLFLALLGQLNYDYCGSMPSEGTRLQAPLSTVWSHRPVRQIAIERGVRELFVNKPCNWPAICLGKREQETDAGESRLLDDIESSRISKLSFRDLVWHIIALRTIGYQANSPELTICEETLQELVDVDEVAGLAHPRFRNGTHADSALAIRSLVESGMSPSHPAIKEGLDSLCHPAAMSSPLSTSDAGNLIEGVRRCATEFESDSALPPDIDVRWDWQYKDGAAEHGIDDQPEAIDSAVALHVERLQKGQNQDGGWGAILDSHQQKKLSEPDATGAALESLAEHSDADVQTALNRAVDFLRLLQRGDGSWEKSDGKQQILCASSAIRGLLAAGVSADDDCIAAAINWLVVQQHPSGGWKGSATQTAWAILGLVAAGRADHPAVRRGIEFLLDSHDDDGGWVDRKAVLREPESNHWFCNDLHSTCWALLALSRFAVAASSAQPAGANGASPRLMATSAEF